MVRWKELCQDSWLRAWQRRHASEPRKPREGTWSATFQATVSKEDAGRTAFFFGSLRGGRLHPVITDNETLASTSSLGRILDKLHRGEERQ